MKPKFLGELVIQEYHPYEWLLYRELEYITVTRGREEIIKAEIGFRTDLASIPRILHSLIPQNGRHRKPAVIHDKLYRTAGLHDYTRAQADAIFLEAMLLVGVPRYRAYLMYSGVRAGGWITWKKALEANNV